MTARNDITGDPLVTSASSNAYRDGWDRIFGKSKSLDAEVFKQAFELVEGVEVDLNEKLDPSNE